MPDQMPRGKPYSDEAATDGSASWDTLMKGQVAIVTGSSLGIGAATARQLVHRGVKVVLNGRSTDLLNQAAAALGTVGEVRAVCGDAAQEETIDALLAMADNLGGLHIVVANTGGGTVGRGLSDLTPEVLADSYRSNVAAAAALVRATAPQLVAQGYGRIVTVSSLAGRRFGRVSGPDYSAHKAALIGLTRHAAADLAPTGVTVNSVAPGVIRTQRALDMFATLGPEASSAIQHGTPMRRWGEPDEVAAAIVFLASPSASYITGHTLDVNGGAYMA